MEKGDGDAGEAAKCWGVRPLGLHRMDLPGCGDAVAWCCQGMVTSGLCVVDRVL